MHAYSAWVTPPLALFLGLAFALLCGQAHPKFNKKTSKYLLQYSVVGLGFGMNLQASLASGKEGMEFLGWREVPTDPTKLGQKAVDCMPYIMQGFVKRPAEVEKGTGV